MKSKRYSVFAVMWVLAVFFHMIHRSDVVSDIFPALTILSGAYVLLNPAKEIRLVLFSLLHACVYFLHAPNTSNHAFFAFCVDLTIMVVYGLNCLNSKSGRSEFFAYLNPIVKSFTIILYFFAVFHKLNYNYLSPDSCGGTLLLDRILNHKAALPFISELSADTITFLRYFNIYASLILETLIPIFLLNRRFAWFGCLLGIILHGTLGFFYFWHFTPTLYALYILFLPDVFYERIYGMYTKYKKGHKVIQYSIRTLFLLVPILYVLKFYSPEIAIELGSFSRNSGRNWSHGLTIRTFVGWLPFLLYTLAFLYILLRYSRTAATPFRTKLPLAYLIFPLLITLNGFSPYLGLKTHQSFSMFSGLLTHEDSNNHLFMPVIDLLETQNDIVTPAKENHTNYRKELRWEQDEKLVYFELQKRVTQLKEQGVEDIELRFWKNGKKVNLKNAEHSPDLIIPLTWWDKKFRIFREIPVRPKGCYY